MFKSDEDGMDSINSKKRRNCSTWSPNNRKVCAGGARIRKTIGLSTIVFLILAPSAQTFRLFGNQVEQFRRFLEFAVINESAYFDVLNCDNKWKCAQQAFKTIRADFNPRLWNSSLNESSVVTAYLDFPQVENPVSILRPNQDCQVALLDSKQSLVITTQALGIIEFQLITDSCSIPPVHVQGGSSFEVTMQDSQFIAVCDVIDHFNGNYTVSCPIPMHSLPRGEEVCVKVTAVLDYEHFDAFNDARASMAPLRRLILDRHVLCRLVPQDDPAVLVGSKYGLEAEAGANRFWKKRFRRHTSVALEWADSETGTFLLKSEFLKCMSQQRVMFIGASHMRYNWDFLVYAYVDPGILERLGRQHSGKSTVLKDLTFWDARYAWEISEALEKEALGACERQQRNSTFVWMTGSWDLKYFSPRHFIHNPKAAPTIIEALKKLKQRRCEEFVRVVWVTTVPAQTAYVEWRNSYALMTAMQWLHASLLDIGYRNLDVVDVFDIVYPTVTGGRHSATCKNHYLCRGGGMDGLYQTEAGLTALSAIVRSVCRQPFGASKRFESQASSLSNRRPPDGSVICISNVSMKANRSDSTPFHSEHEDYYLISNGLLRKFPNVDTVQFYLQAQVESGRAMVGVVDLQAEDVRDFALGEGIPSRKDGTIVLTEFIRGSYHVILGGKRFPMSSPMEYFSKRSHNCVASAYDVNDIPMSQITLRDYLKQKVLNSSYIVTKINK